MTEEALFHAALALSTADRPAYLAEHCPDPELRQRVEALLAAHDGAGGVLDQSPATGAYESSHPPVTDASGSHIGPYKLLQRIGEGGMGTVYMAEQTSPVRRMVAVKLIKPGMDSRQVLARFEAERQALALMDHPNIAKVLDAGQSSPATAAGQAYPYFVMELVKGIPITKYCDQQHLTPRERLDLFVPVCHAVQHAHQKGIIHRDLKPSNVLIALYDGRPVPKVIDFGVAKALHQRLTDKTMFTEFGAVVGTLEYMSPEQAELNQLDIDTRSDIYSLGVILYELLTGSTPFDRKRLKSAAFDELLRIIREEEPPKPSTRLSGSEELPSIAANRRTEPKRLGKLVRGELDWVVMKCLEKDRGRRYETANGLALDVQRYLADEPVVACPPSAGYRLKKYVRRNKGRVVAAGLVLLALVGGLGAVVAVQSVANARLAASLEREKQANDALTRSRAAVQMRYDLALDAIKTFHTGESEEWLLKDDRFKALRDRHLKSAADFYRKLGGLLDKETDFASRRALAQSNFELADLTRKVGRSEDALAAHRAVLAAREALAAEPEADLAIKADVGRSLTEVASLQQTTGRSDEALATYRRAESMLAEPAVSNPAARAALAACRTKRALLLFYQNDYAEALSALKLARADQEPLAAAPGASTDARRDLAETVNQGGFFLWNMGKPAAAETELRTALALYQKLADENPADPEFRRGLGASHFYLGNVLGDQGKPGEAEAELRSAIALQEKVAKDYPAVTKYRRSLAVARFYLGVTLALNGRLELAVAEYHASITIVQNLIDENAGVDEFRSILASVRARLGESLLHMGKPRDAEIECRGAQLICQEIANTNSTLPIYRLRHAWALNFLGDVVRSFGRFAEAKGLYDQATALAEPLAQRDSDNTDHNLLLVASLRRRGLALRDLGDFAPAAADFRRALRLCDGLAEWNECLYETACCHATLAGLAGRAGSGVSAAEGPAEADAAMKWLSRAAARGYRNANAILLESAFDSVRKRPDLNKLFPQN